VSRQNVYVKSLRERAQNAKLRMVWNIPLTIFSPSHQPAKVMAFDDFSSTHTEKYKLPVIKLHKYHDGT
jgi:hypothetical protein